MKSLAQLVVAKPRSQTNTRETERGELLKTFLAGIRPTWDEQKFGKLTIGRIAKKVEGIATKDLYYLDRVCSDSKHYGKRFFFELDPSKHRDV